MTHGPLWYSGATFSSHKYRTSISGTAGRLFSSHKFFSLFYQIFCGIHHKLKLWWLIVEILRHHYTTIFSNSLNLTQLSQSTSKMNDLKLNHEFILAFLTLWQNVYKNAESSSDNVVIIICGVIISWWLGNYIKYFVTMLRTWRWIRDSIFKFQEVIMAS